MDSVFCRDCGIDLVCGDNWYGCHKDSNNYICIPCHLEDARKRYEQESEEQRARRRRKGKQWKRDNVASVLVSRAKQRASNLDIPFSLSPDDIEVPDVCPVLGVEMEPGAGTNSNSPSLDRLVPSQGYVVGNVKVISSRANRLRGDHTVEEVEAVLQYMRGIEDDGS